MTNVDQSKTIPDSALWGHPKCIILGTKKTTTQTDVKYYYSINHAIDHLWSTRAVAENVYCVGAAGIFWLYVVMVGNEPVHLAIKDNDIGSRKSEFDCITEALTLVYDTPSEELYYVELDN